MILGIRPIVDFAFKKIYGTPENRMALISLLNAILNLKLPIVDVTLQNPYNLQDFKDDKLSILDIKAVDQSEARSSALKCSLEVFDCLDPSDRFLRLRTLCGSIDGGRPIFATSKRLLDLPAERCDLEGRWRIASCFSSDRRNNQTSFERHVGDTHA